MINKTKGLVLSYIKYGDSSTEFKWKGSVGCGFYDFLLIKNK